MSDDCRTSISDIRPWRESRAAYVFLHEEPKLFKIEQWNYRPEKFEIQFTTKPLDDKSNQFNSIKGEARRNEMELTVHIKRKPGDHMLRKFALLQTGVPEHFHSPTPRVLPQVNRRAEF